MTDSAHIINSPKHTFDREIKRVAVIGAGPTGTPLAKHLRDEGLQVRVFERQPQAGGIWNWREDSSLPLSIPTPPPSRGAFTPTVRPEGSYPVEDKKEIDLFFPPNPCYWNLTNNVPIETLVFKDFPYPEGTASHVSHTQISGYVHAYFKEHKLDEITSFKTRVESAIKKDGEWILTLRKIVDGVETQWQETFDAIVSATGHYNAPLIPKFPGATEWAKQWPDRLIHSQGYRRPEHYADKTVLIVGAGTSGVDIARDVFPHVKHLYVVGKNEIRGPASIQGLRKLQRLAAVGEVVPEIESFSTPASTIEQSSITLTDGRVLTGIDHIIFATGYQYSFPYLPQYHRDPNAPVREDAAPVPLITNGEGVLNLWRDIFYIPDPTLAFIGLSVNTSAFSFFEYQGLAIARVFSGKAKIPDEENRWEFYKELVKIKGEGKFGHLMGKDNERIYVRETVAWLNSDAEWSGAPIVEGHSEEWLANSDKTYANILAKYGLSAEQINAIREGTQDPDIRPQPAISSVAPQSVAVTQSA